MKPHVTVHLRLGAFFIALVMLLAAQRATLADPDPSWTAKSVEVRQPDGTKFFIDSFGEDFFTWYADQWGYTVILDGGSYMYAILNDDGDLAPTDMLVGQFTQQQLQDLLPTPAATTESAHRMFLEARAGDNESAGPRPDSPGEAVAFRLLQERDETGTIPPNALMQAVAQRRAMPVLPAAWVPFAPAARTGGPAPIAGIQPSAWTLIGPGNIGGRVRAIVIHPTTPATMWAGSVGGGIWKTTDGGASWFPLNDFMANLAVSSMAIDPTNPNVLYAGTGEGFYNGDGIQGAGIFKTTDGGTTWTQLSSTTGSEFYYINRIAVSPDGTTVLATSSSGLQRSTNGGSTWTQVLSPGTRVTDVNFNPSDSTKAIASGYQHLIYYSTNGGLTWQPPTTGLTTGTGYNGGRVEIAYAPSNPSIVYAAYDSAGTNSGQIWRSTDGGANFTLVKTATWLSGQGWYANALWVDPTNANTLVVGGLDLWKSTDGGATLAQISQWYSAPSSAHADHHIIVNHPNYDGSTNKTVFFGNDGGIYKAADLSTVSLTAGWTELNNNFGVTQFYGAAGNVNTGTIVGGAQDNGTLRYTTAGGSENWTAMFGGDGGYCAADPGDSNYFYGEYVYLDIHRSTNGGASSSYIYTGLTDANSGTTANFIAPFIIDPNNSNTLLAGGASLWRSSNAKAATPTWAAIKPSTGSLISAIAVAPGHSDVIWVGHNNGDVYFTTNGTATTPTWMRADLGTPNLPNRYCTRLTIDANNSAKVYATFGGYSAGNVWRTADSGTTWTNIAAGLPSAPVRSLVISPLDSNALYIGTEVGIFASADGGSSWSPTNDGPANVSVDELFWLGYKLVAVTHGRGLFTATVTSDPLSVSPAGGLISTGPGGGPFTPASTVYTLTNSGATALNWTATKTQPWFDLSASGGTLPAGNSINVTVTLNAQAATLVAGAYTDSVTFTNTTSSVIQNRPVSLAVSQPRIAYFPMDSDPGWTRQGQWAYGTPTGGGGTLHGSPDPTVGATGSAVFGVNLSGDYSLTVGGPYYLTAGPFNFTGRTNTKLQFQRWLNTDFQPYAFATIDVSTNGTTWTSVWNNGSVGETADSAWTKVQYDISAIADNQPSVYVRWGYQVGSGAFAYSGWNIDDVELLGTSSAPTISSLNRANPTPSNAATVNWTLTFSSAVTGVTAGNFSLSGAAATGASIGTPTTANGGLTWNVPVTTGASDGPLTLSMANSTGQSPAVSTTLPFAGASYTIDKTAPTLTARTIASNNGNTAWAKVGDAIALSLTASEPINAPAVTIAGRAATVTGGGTNWSAAITVMSDPEGVAALSVSYSDLAGNTGTAATTTTDNSSVTIDRTAPTIAIGAPSATLTNTGPVTYVVTYSDVNFSASTLALANITLNKTGTANGSLAVTGTGNTRTVTLSGITGDGTLGISIAAGTATDMAGNTAPASGASTTFTVDNTPPTLTARTIASNNANTAWAKVGDVVTVGLTASEPINTPAVTIAGRAATVTGGGTNWSAAITVMGDPEGVAALSVTYSDLAGNAGTAATTTTDNSSVTIDRTAPTITIGAPSATQINTGPVAYVVTYSDANFSASTLAVANIALNKTGTANGSLAVTGSGNTRTVTVSGITGDGTLGISIAAETASDTAGNLAPASGASATFTVDNTPPTMTARTIASNNANTAWAKAGDVITLSLTASEPISAPTVMLAGHAAAVTGNGTSWTANITVLGNDPEGVAALSVSYSDLAGNAGTAATTTTDNSLVTIDRTAPTIAIGAPSATLTNTGPVTYAVTYSDANFSASTLSVANITLNKTGTANASLAVAGSGNTRTVTVSGITGDGTLGISIAAGTASDTAGNSAPVSGASTTFTVDNTPPTLTARTIASNNGNTAWAKIGDVITLSLTASEPISAPTVAIAGRAATVTGSGTAWSASVTVTGAYPEGVASLNVSFSDLAGNAGTAIATTTDNSTVTIDRTAPVIATGPPSATATRSGPVTYTVTYTDANFNASTLSLATVVLKKTGNASGTLSVDAGTGSTRTVTIANITGNGTLGIATVAGTASDMAGNTATASGPSATFIVDNTAPSLTTRSIASNNPNTAMAKFGDVITLSLTASEPINAPAVTLAGRAATVTGGGADWSATITVSGSDPEGIAGLNVSYSDVLGNVGAAATTTTDGSSVTIDRTGPAISFGAPSVPSTNAGPVTYLVTYTGPNFSASTLAVADITLNKTGTANGTVGVTGTGNTRTVTVSGITGIGTLGISVAAGTASDMAGNIAAASAASATFTVFSVDLSALGITARTLIPAFSPATTSYQISPYLATTTSTKVTPTLADSSTTVTVNGTAVASGTASGAIPVPAGTSVITIVVTGPDTVTKKTYTITVSRPASANADLSWLKPGTGTLAPAFASATTDYSATVANSVTSTTVTPTVAQIYATVKVNGSTVASGTVSGAIALAVGPNSIPVVVTAEDGVTQKTYTLTVTRQPVWAGSYDGLAVPVAGAANPELNVGLGLLTIASAGGFSGKFTLGGSATGVSISGTIDVNGVARFGTAKATTVDLVRAGLPTVTLAMHLDVQFPLTHQVIGTLSQGATVLATVELNRRLYTSTVPALAPMMNVPLNILDPATDNGKNTGIFQSLDPAAQGLAASAYPQGDGWTLVTVKSTGAVTLSGNLADGEPVSYTNYLSKDNVLPFYVPLYSGTGSASGRIRFRDVPGQSDADGPGLLWFKNANASDTAYVNGWPTGIKVDYLGSKLMARTTSRTMLGNSPAVSPAVNALLALSDAGLTGVLSNTLTLTSAGGVVMHGAPSGGTAAPGLSVALQSTGTFTGSFLSPVTSTTTLFKGVVLQKAQRAAGYFLATPSGAAKQESGAVTITAQ